MTLPAPATAERVLNALVGRGLTLATAESLTGGLLSATLVEVPGASRSFTGGIVSYATRLKHELLGVDAGLLERHGAVHPEVAAAMARGVRERCGADIGVATTGVAGPAGQDGHPPGEVYVAVALVDRVEVREHRFEGDRARIRDSAVRAALDLIAETAGLTAEASRPDPGGVEPE